MAYAGGLEWLKVIATTGLPVIAGPDALSALAYG
jgi:hypothetical protein